MTVPSSTFGPPAVALVRPPSDAFRGALQEVPEPLEPARARAQHGAYVAALEAAGLTVQALPASDVFPDACFVEDTAVVTGEHALATVPGAPSRRGEVVAVEGWLRAHVSVHAMGDGGATLDGGDVLRVGTWLFVGLSRRTCREGMDALIRVAATDGLTVVPVPVRAGLHLKSAVTLLTPEVVVCRAACVDLAPFKDRGLRCLEAAEPEGANVLALGERVLVSASAPQTADRIVDLGLSVECVDVSELHKADGALTCLSIRLPTPGQWCA